MRRPEHTEDRSPVELPWSLIQGGSFLTAFQAAQHITILTLLCSAKEKLWWKHNWETGKSFYVCERACVWECVCACTCVPPRGFVCAHACSVRACSCMHVCVFVCVCVCVCLPSVWLCMSATVCACVTTKTGQQWETKQCQAATLCSLIIKWVLYSWVRSYWPRYKGLIFDLYSCWWFSQIITVSNPVDNMSKRNSSSGE